MDIVVAGVLCYPGVTSMVAPDDDLLRLMLWVAQGQRRRKGEERRWRRRRKRARVW